MRILNCTGEPIQVTAYRNHFRGPPWLARSGTIPNNESWPHNMSADGIELEVSFKNSGAISDSRYGWKPSGWIFADQLPNPDFPNTTLVIVTNHRDHLFVDWKQATKGYRENAARLTDKEDTPNDSVQQELETGAAMAGALATGIAAMGEKGALPSGALMGLGHILLLVLGGKEADLPTPPDSAEIQSIVTEVVKRELDIQDAEKAATAFAMATEQLRSLSKKLAEHDSDDGVIPAYLEEDLEELISAGLALGPEGTLSFSVNHMLRYPKMAKWILPELVGGLATYLTLQRMNILRDRTSEDGSGEIKVTVADVADYVAQVRRCREGLNAIYETAQAYVAEKTEAKGLHGTLHEKDFQALVRKSMYGIDNLDAVVTAIHDLERIESMLNDDILNGTTSHFWRVASTSPPQPPRPVVS